MSSLLPPLLGSVIYLYIYLPPVLFQQVSEAHPAHPIFLTVSGLKSFPKTRHSQYFFSLDHTLETHVQKFNKGKEGKC